MCQQKMHIYDKKTVALLCKFKETAKVKDLWEMVFIITH